MKWVTNIIFWYNLVCFLEFPPFSHPHSSTSQIVDLLDGLLSFFFFSLHSFGLWSTEQEDCWGFSLHFHSEIKVDSVTLSTQLQNETQYTCTSNHTHRSILNKQTTGTYFNQTQLQRQLLSIYIYKNTKYVNSVIKCCDSNITTVSDDILWHIHSYLFIQKIEYHPLSSHLVFPSDHLLIQCWVTLHTQIPTYSRGREGSWELMDESSNQINLMERWSVWSSRSRERTHMAVFGTLLKQEDLIWCIMELRFSITAIKIRNGFVCADRVSCYMACVPILITIWRLPWGDKTMVATNVNSHFMLVTVCMNSQLMGN